MNKTIFSVIVLVAIMMIATTPSTTFATKNAFSSGFSHGQSDCNLPYNQQYINGVNKDGESTGRDHHTDEFLRGYDAGYATCSNNIIQNVDNNIRENTQNQAAETNQGVTCHVLIGNCNTGQSSENAFANKNNN